MALNAGEVEATLRLRDELSTQVVHALDTMKEFGLETVKTSAQARTAFEGMFSELPVQAKQSTTATFEEVQTIPRAMTEAADASSSKWGTMWDDMTAKAYKEVSAIGTSVGDNLKSFIENPIEGVKGALSSGLEAMGPFGVGLAAIGTVAGAVAAGLYELASGAAEAGEKIETFGQMTGTAVEKIGAIAAGAKIADSSLDSVQSMLTQLTRRLEASGPAAETFDEALGHLGISATAFRAADPSDRINILSDGMQRAAGSTTLMNDALAIMGRAGVQNIHFLMENTEEARKKAEELAYVWSEEDVEAADKFDESVTMLGLGLEKLSTTIGVAVLPTMTKLVEGTIRFGEALINVSGIPGYVAMFDALTGAMGNTALAEQTLGAAMDNARHLFAEATKEGLSAGDAADEVATKMLALGYSEETVARATNQTVDAIKLLKAEMKAATDAADGWIEAINSINANEAARQIDDWSQATRKLIVAQVEAGNTIETVAAAWKTVPATIQAIVDADKALIDVQKDLQEELRATANWLGEKQMEAIAKSMKAEEDFATRSRALINEINVARMDADAKAMESASDRKAVEENTLDFYRTNLDKIAAKARGTYEAMAAESWKYRDSTIQHFRDTADAAELAANSWETSFFDALDVVGDKADETTQRLLKVTTAAQQGSQLTGVTAEAAAAAGGVVNLDAYGNAYIHIPGVNLPGRPAPGRVAGGPVEAGKPYTVGEERPELFVPSTSGRIEPSGGGGRSVNVVINFSALTPGDARAREQLRQTVEKVIVDTLKNRVHLGSS